MTKVTEALYRLRIWRDTRGQDMVEYALMASMVAIAVGAIFPPVRTEISTIWSKLGSTMEEAP